MLSNASNLDEIVITQKDPQDILKLLIQKSRNKITVPANLKVYTREFFKKNDIYTYYNDGLLNFQILENNKKVKTDILVEQNRSIGFIDAFDKSILGYDLNNLMENYYMFVYLEDLLHSKAKKIYSFQIRTYVQNDSYNYLNSQLNSANLQNNISQEILLKQEQLLKMENETLNTQLYNLDQTQSIISNKDTIKEQTDKELNKKNNNINFLIFMLIISLLTFCVIMLGHQGIIDSFKMNAILGVLGLHVFIAVIIFYDFLYLLIASLIF